MFRKKRDKWEDLIEQRIVFRVQRMAIDGGYFEQELRTGVVERVGAGLVLIDGVWREQDGIRVHCVLDHWDNPNPVNLP
jgi:hypothetical protein